eukprot:TRINITY_DN4098_c0_g1_i1.p1 TRINITY_DN4098_c0_g1~~TRINITY_DN4098_c0_g1_i1.p1  ORF type:complete len:198 (-),score=33.83 TRINITY_DN4098_c0_g1_i1:45-638(-)
MYICRFRDPNKMITETGYYFTHLESALYYIENLDAVSLRVSPEEWDSYMNPSCSDQPKTNTQSEDLLNLEVPKTSDSENTTTSVSTLTNSNLNSSVLSDDLLDFSEVKYEPLPIVDSNSSSNDDGLNTDSTNDGTSSNLDSENLVEERARFVKFTVEDLKLGDIGSLLRCYKQAVLENERLREQLDKLEKQDNSNPV